MDSTILSSNVRRTFQARGQVPIRGLTKPVVNEKLKKLFSYMENEATPVEVEAAYLIYSSYMSGFSNNGGLPAPMEPFDRYQTSEIINLILKNLKLNEKTFEKIFEENDTSALVKLIHNPHLTLEQSLMLLKHDEISDYNKKPMVKKFSRDIIETLLDEPWEFKYLLCASPVLTEAEVREFASFHPAFLFSLLENPLTPIELIYKEAMVNRNLTNKVIEADERHQLQKALFDFRWNDFKVFLSQKYDLDLEPYDKHWVMRFLNWDDKNKNSKVFVFYH